MQMRESLAGHVRTSMLLALFAVILASRRGAQLVSPQVWNEDGTQVLHGLLTKGWTSFLDPVNGYLILVPKAVSAFSLAISFHDYPLVSTIVAWGVIALVGLAIVHSPTLLRGRLLCALAAFAIPSDPEVFGLPLYTFWWTSLLLFLVALWNVNGARWGWRMGFLVAGGLSSPVIALVLPVLYFRAWKFRAHGMEILVAVVATAIAAVQLYFILANSAGKTPPLASLLVNTVPTFFGKFLVGNFTEARPWLWAASALVLGLMVPGVRAGPDRVLMWILFYLLVGSIALSVSRADPVILHPRHAGPRYFYMPFLLTFWILVQCALAARSRLYRAAVAAVSAIAVLNALPAWSRSHDDLDWAGHVRSCAHFENYRVPVHYDGNKALAWNVMLAGKVCRERLQRERWVPWDVIQARPVYPYAVVPGKEDGPMNGEPPQVMSATMSGADFQKSQIPGYRVIGSFRGSDADTGEVVVKLRRGERIRYRSGPGGQAQTLTIVGYEGRFISRLPVADEWIGLEFANDLLPSEFVVKVEDHGSGFGEWSAIALRAGPRSR